MQWPDAGMWRYRGRRIRDAVVTSLLAQHGLAGQSAVSDDFVAAGCVLQLVTCFVRLTVSA